MEEALAHSATDLGPLAPEADTRHTTSPLVPTRRDLFVLGAGAGAGAGVAVVVGDVEQDPVDWTQVLLL